MAKLGEEYNRILSEIEATISNESEKEIVKQKVIELSSLFLSNMEKMSDMVDNKLAKLEEKQKELDDKIEKINKSVSEIENDIYDEEENGEFDFEIVCPYCSYEFVTDLNMLDDEKSEIKCPECNNIIELDWNDEEDEEGCSGHCSSCHGCGDEEENEEDEDM